MRVRCKQCKGYFEKDEIAFRLPIGQLCSEACFNEFTHRKKPAKKATDIPPKVRKACLERDGGRCQLCHREGHHLHHVLYRSEGGKHVMGNLITLCAEDHALVHSDKKVYQPKLLKILARKKRQTT